MMAVTFKNKYLKWIISVGIVVTIYSLSYFYSMLPSNDAQYFRGSTEYFIKTKNLDPLQNSYYQWPCFFILSYIATSVSGLTLANFEFILYTIIGFFLATTLYVCASKAYKNAGFLAVIAFFISMFLLLNYQCVPFSLALGLLFLMFMLETRQKSIGLTITMLVLFASISITHAFVPLFFVLYLLIQNIFNGTRQYRNLFLFTFVSYLLVQFTLAQFSFERTITGIMALPSEYSNIVTTQLSPASVPIDTIVQMFSRTVTIGFYIICGAGFFILLIKRKMRTLDKAIFLTGATYSGIGIFLNIFGSRAIPLAFIPVSLGAAYLLESRFRTHFKYIFSVLLIVLLILFPFIPLHQSFATSIGFQTREAYRAENFFIDYYNWTKPSFILANMRVETYLMPKLSGAAYFSYEPRNANKADTIFYTVGLCKDFLGENYTIASLFQEERLNVVYNNGFSYIMIKAQP
jgi:hypothetical protein